MAQRDEQTLTPPPPKTWWTCALADTEGAGQRFKFVSLKSPTPKQEAAHPMVGGGEVVERGVEREVERGRERERSREREREMRRHTDTEAQTDTPTRTLALS